MNISITQISNGWILAIATPQGNNANHYATKAALLKALADVMSGAVSSGE